MAAESYNIQRWLLRLVKGAISSGAIYFLLSRFDFSNVVGIVRNADWRYILLGALLAPMVPACLALRFVAVLRKGGMRASIGTCLRITWIGQFWNFFLPGSAGGDLYRLAYVWKLRPDDRSQGFFAVFSDRVLATSLLLPVAALSIILLAPSGLPVFVQPLWFQKAMFVAGLLFLLGGVTFFVFRGRLIGHCKTLLERAKSKLKNAGVYFSPDRDLAFILLLAVIAHLINFAVFFCFARSLGLDISYWQVMLLLPPIIIMLMLPLSINGHGVREFLFIFFLSALGVGYLPGHASKLPETVLALSVVGLSVDLICNLPGGLIFAFSRGDEPTTDFSSGQS